MRKLLLSAFILLNVAQVAHAHRDWSNDDSSTDTPTVNDNLPILVIGASFGNGNTPFEYGTSSPLLGLAVNGGKYLSLGDALVRAPGHNGHVVNEAQAGATTFAHPSCRTALYGGACSSAEFNSYETQLLRAASRVRSLATGEYNAEYVIITAPNDCLHSDTFGIPEANAISCDIEDMQDAADRLVDVGRLAISLGITPIFAEYPPVEAIDLEGFRQSSLLAWTISESDYQLLNDTVMATLTTELPDALFINYWADFTQLGDGIHPDAATVKKAANIILQEIGYAVTDSEVSCGEDDHHNHHDKKRGHKKHSKHDKKEDRRDRKHHDRKHHDRDHHDHDDNRDNPNGNGPFQPL